MAVEQFCQTLVASVIINLLPRIRADQGPSQPGLPAILLASSPILCSGLLVTMSGPVEIASAAEWQALLSATSVVVADFYADWCGPCKTIAPHFERLAREHGRPKEVAFAKVNVDSQTTVARANAVSAMPTFKIFHAGKCIDTIKGANPSALSEAVSRAVALAGTTKSGDVFRTPGRTLGGEGSSSAPRPAFYSAWDVSGLAKMLLNFVGLYLVSLFSLDARKAAEKSPFNIHRAASSQTPSSAGPGGPSRPTQKPSFRTLADLGSG